MSSEGKGIEITIAILAVLAIVGLSGLFYGYQYIESKRELSRVMAITGNLRQVSSAGQQYILEESATSVTYNELVGEYFHDLGSVAGESYNTLVVTKEGGVLKAQTSSGLEVAFTY
ncbi:hypothetical protein [Cerasicoccus maritimus]|uniref:hypothetical protein n=1 Tax=Cerasicoccus maritimus TaxID=490089 RepID=UPI00285273C2|nr:hypothetical protein [Cerasicoccus maritimus]